MFWNKSLEKRSLVDSIGFNAHQVCETASRGGKRLTSDIASDLNPAFDSKILCANSMYIPRGTIERMIM